MTENPDQTPDDNQPPPFIRAIFEQVGEVVEEHERAHLRAHDRQNRVYGLIDGLSVEQLLALRLILNSGGPKRSWASDQYYDGLVVQTLRLKHDVDPDHPDDDPRLIPTLGEPVAEG